MREGIVHVLRSAGFDVVGEAGDVPGLLAVVEAQRPDVVVVDIRMPPTHTDEGLVAATQIGQRHPGIGILVLSQYVEPEYAAGLLAEFPEGVGYLLKERIFDVAVLTDALRRIGEGECVIDPTIVSRLMERRRRHGTAGGALAPRAGGAGAHCPRPFELGDRGAAGRHRAHSRGACHPDLREAGPRAEPGGPSARSRGSGIPTRKLSTRPAIRGWAATGNRVAAPRRSPVKDRALTPSPTRQPRGGGWRWAGSRWSLVMSDQPRSIRRAAPVSGRVGELEPTSPRLRNRQPSTSGAGPDLPLRSSGRTPGRLRAVPVSLPHRAP